MNSAQPKDAGQDRQGTSREVIEPEVLPPPPGGPRKQQQGQRQGSDRIKYILIGLALDLLDFFTFGPLGIKVGFFVGSIAAFALLGLLDVPMPKRIMISIGAGLYCMLPGTAPLPLGTLLGALLKLR